MNIFAHNVHEKILNIAHNFLLTCSLLSLTKNLKLIVIDIETTIVPKLHRYRFIYFLEFPKFSEK